MHFNSFSPNTNFYSDSSSSFEGETYDRQTDTLHYAFILLNVTLQLNGNMSVIDPIEPSLSRAKVIFFVEDYAACSYIECSGQFLFSRARSMVEQGCY